MPVSAPPEVVLARHARARGGVFTTGDVAAAGFEPAEVRRRLRERAWVRLRRSTYTTKAVFEAADADPTRRHRLRVAAALAATQRTWASDVSAATVLELDLLRVPAFDDLHLLRPAAGATRLERRGDLVIRECGLPMSHRTTVDGVRTTTPARTAIDLARFAPLLDGVVAMDSAMRRRGARPRDLQRVLDDCVGWPGTVAAQAARELADPRSESVLESVSRVELVRHGLAPETQCWLAGPAGAMRVDFLWWEQRTIGEADGLGKYVKYGPEGRLSPLQLEKLRQEALEELGFEVVRWTSRDIRTDPAAVAERVRRAFARSAVRQEIRARTSEPDLVRRLPAAPWDLPRDL